MDRKHNTPLNTTMKVCHFTEFESRVSGGIETSIRQQQTALSQADIEFTTNPRESFDVLHLNLLGPRSVYQLLKAKATGRPVIVHTHVTGDDFKDSLRFSNQIVPIVERYTTSVYNTADHLIAPSDYTKGLLKSKGITTPITVISNGIDTDRLAGHDSVSLAEDYRTDRFTIVTVGFTYERKGVSDFVAVGETLKNVSFRWFGPRVDGILSSNGTADRIAQSPENVHFHGYVDDIRAAFAVADVFFFPSHEENQGIALLEAAYCGLPLVIRDIPTYDGWFIGETHCLKGDSVEEFVTVISRLRSDPSLRRRLGTSAHRLAEDHTLETVASELVQCYENVCNN